MIPFDPGLCGSASMSHGPAMANDLFNEDEIGLPLTLAGVGRFGGPTLGPLIGGFITQYAGELNVIEIGKRSGSRRLIQTLSPQVGDGSPTRKRSSVSVCFCSHSFSYVPSFRLPLFPFLSEELIELFVVRPSDSRDVCSSNPTRSSWTSR